MAKKPFDVDTVFRRIKKEVAGFADAAMFDLRTRGFTTVFQQLVACIISIRTYDEVSLPAAVRLFEKAPDARSIAKLSVKQIDSLISTSTFHETKANQIRAIAVAAVEEFGGELPADSDVLMSFKGVGPKCANLALGVAAGQEHISVDVHVGRVTVRWGYVKAGSADSVRRQLEAKLPRRYWIEINRLLVPFGKHICTGRLPKCSTCPVLEYCRQVGVEAHR
ncbi:MAG TPA: endonuclease III [Gemmatimonadaceae bacterium]|jgi:endonuclease-3|nr:endonuclease III [Gemmatimonadaceae bacterium]